MKKCLVTLMASALLGETIPLLFMYAVPYLPPAWRLDKVSLAIWPSRLGSPWRNHPADISVFRQLRRQHA
jgi:hypothetical protein